MEISSMESDQMSVEAAFLNSKLIESDSTEQIIIIDPSGGSNIMQENSAIQNSNMNKQSTIWECDCNESALSSSDDSSPGKNNQGQEPKQCSSKQSDEIQDKQSKKIVRKNYGRVKIGNQVSNVEDSAVEVRKRFEMGCECADSCFRGLNPEAVYRHRLNIAELTKEEHDMYLMGVTMACMSDPVSTNKRRERRRARPNYAYSGRRVCLSAFLYLENVTLYQLKRIRKHVMTHGVTPRIHGNHGKKPHNVFPLDIYRRATYFLKDFIQQHNISGNPKGPIVLPPDVTRKSVHNTYKDYVSSLYSPNEKILGYSTFRHFMKEQFPNLRFSKTEPEDMLCGEQNLSINDVVDLLEKQFAIITGSKSREGYPVITLPDGNNFAELSDSDYQKLMMYLTSVPSMHEADLGFAILIDRRNDKWNSVRATLLKISAYFPGLIHVAYVIRPSRFFQKVISEVSNNFFKEEFKFKVVVCSSTQELHKYLDKGELTAEMDGTMPYCHKQWIQQRIALEEFSQQMAAVSRSLDVFTFELRGSGEGLACAGCTGAGVSVLEVESTLRDQASDYARLKESIAEAARRGEQLLSTIRRRIDTVGQQEPSSFVNITTVERLLVQLEETERTFDDYWEEHSARSRQYLEIYRFYSDFKLIQGVLEQHLKTVAQSTEIGETVQRVEYLIREFNSFKKICMCDMERSEELVTFGRILVRGRHYWPLECVTLRCDELDRACASLMDRLTQRSDTLARCHQLQITVDKANRWCQWGIELLGTSHIEKCSCALDAAERSLSELIMFLAEAEQFTNLLIDYSAPETKALVSQVLQRIDDVRLMCSKRVTTLKRLVEKPPRPVQTVNPEPRVLASAVNFNHVRTNLQIQPPPKFSQECTDGQVKSGERLQEKEHEIKRHHVLSELLETERVYVAELGSIIKGYKHAMTIEETKTLVPPELDGKADVLFGNLEDIYTFHGDIFLQDLENCISTTELVALCFTHRRDSFHRLYSCYCQNMTRSERLRESLGDNTFFRACQLRLGHKLPLAAYLLKPVQRITKYQLLLKDLLAYSEGQKWCSELQEALECMLEVLKCVNDSMHQIAITGFWGDLGDLGDLLTQGSFSIWSESKKDRLKELRKKPMQRHIFLYQKAMLFCKKTAAHNKATYLFKRLLKMGEIGLTETVRGDGRTFEVWLSGRSEVHTIQAATPEEKISWVEQIKSLLLHQLTQLKMKQVTNKSMHMRNVRQAISLDSSLTKTGGVRTNSCDENNIIKAKPSPSDEDFASSSDLSNSEDEETFSNQASRYIALADYSALGHSELSMKEGEKVSLLKVGCAGWWYVRHLGLTEGSRKDGWVPAAYLEHCGRKSSSRSSQSVTSQNSSNNEV